MSFPYKEDEILPEKICYIEFYKKKCYMCKFIKETIQLLQQN